MFASIAAAFNSYAIESVAKAIEVAVNSMEIEPNPIANAIG